MNRILDTGIGVLTAIFVNGMLPGGFTFCFMHRLYVRMGIRDDVVDDYFNKIKKDLAAYIAVNEEHVDCAIDYLMIAKYLERLGDHAVNICEWVQFYKTGMHKSERIL